jgi:hypothetical protein
MPRDMELAGAASARPKGDDAKMAKSTMGGCGAVLTRGATEVVYASALTFIPTTGKYLVRA